MKKKIEKGTIVRTVALIFALINQVLVISGYNPLPFTDEEFGQAMSMVLTIGASLWAWWKNNSFTQAAIAADEQIRK
ncbi:MAG: phage holin [Hespellia sp.]|nr:phage holin [Hespellia sp.]